jgi:exodeoxyribonuclease VII large subunit
LLAHGQAEVIVVTRGGGSKDDLLAFQDEGLARFLAHCPVPVVSAVGHQIDTTLADLVADAVAPTPTAAAMLVLPDGDQLAVRIDERELALRAAMGRRLRSALDRVASLRSRLRDPSDRLREVRRRAREAEARLRLRFAATLTARRDRVVTLQGRVQELAVRRLLPSRHRLALAEGRIVGWADQTLPRAHDRVAALERRLHASIVALLERRRLRVDALGQRSQALSPLAVLERGYAVVSGPEGVLDSPPPTGTPLRIRLARGELDAISTSSRVMDGGGSEA